MADNKLKSRAQWAPHYIECLVRQLQRQSDLGRRCDAGWNKEAWKQATAAFNTELGLCFSVAQCKSRLLLVMNALGKLYTVFVF